MNTYYLITRTSTGLNVEVLNESAIGRKRYKDDTRYIKHNDIVYPERYSDDGSSNHFYLTEYYFRRFAIEYKSPQTSYEAKRCNDLRTQIKDLTDKYKSDLAVLKDQLCVEQAIHAVCELNDKSTQTYLDILVANMPIEPCDLY